MNIDAAATRARVAQDTQALDNRLTKLHQLTGALLDQLSEINAQTRASHQLDDLKTAQTASNNATDATTAGDTPRW